MLHLDYISCLLTILSTVLIGKRLWHGWILAAVNSLIICVIGIQTAQYGFLPGNLLCIGLYAHNLANWRPGMLKQCAPSLALNDNQDNREQSLSWAVSRSSDRVSCAQWARAASAQSDLPHIRLSFPIPLHVLGAS